MKKVLFLCIENACRSIIAEAYFNSKLVEGWKAHSAGIKPAKEIDSNVIEVLREIGVEVKKDAPTLISQEIAKNAVISITMGCMEDECPAALTPYREDWDLEDPKGGSIEKFRKVRDEIISRVDKLVEDIKNGRFY